MKLDGIGSFIQNAPAEKNNGAGETQQEKPKIRDFWKSSTGEEADNLMGLMKEIGKAHKERPFGPVKVAHYGSKAEQAGDLRRMGKISAVNFGIFALVTAGVMVLTSPLAVPALLGVITTAFSGASALKFMNKARDYENNPQKLQEGNVTVEKTENQLTDKQKKLIQDMKNLMGSKNIS